MAAKIDIYSGAWCELVFECKNKNYGAYLLRKFSANRHITALIIAVVVFLLVVSAPGLIKSLVPEKKEVDLTVRMLSEINLNKPKEDNILKDINITPPILRNTIKFTPPVIKKDEEVNEEAEMKTQQEVVDVKTAIGSTDYDEGTDNIEAPMPTEDQQVAGESDEPFVVVEQMPEFPGGMRALLIYLARNIKYPELARSTGIQGKVFIRFVVDETGKVTKVQVMRGIGGGCDEEAVRVLTNSPNWLPGKQRGKPVRVYYTVPVNFQLQ